MQQQQTKSRGRPFGSTSKSKHDQNPHPKQHQQLSPNSVVIEYPADEQTLAKIRSTLRRQVLELKRRAEEEARQQREEKYRELQKRPSRQQQQQSSSEEEDHQPKKRRKQVHFVMDVMLSSSFSSSLTPTTSTTPTTESLSLIHPDTIPSVEPTWQEEFYKTRTTTSTTKTQQNQNQKQKQTRNILNSPFASMFPMIPESRNNDDEQLPPYQQQQQQSPSFSYVDNVDSSSFTAWVSHPLPPPPPITFEDIFGLGFENIEEDFGFLNIEPVFTTDAMTMVQSYQ